MKFGSWTYDGYQVSRYLGIMALIIPQIIFKTYNFRGKHLIKLFITSLAFNSITEWA